MATLEVGSVTIAADGTASGDGLALNIFNGFRLARADLFAVLPALGFPDAVPPANDRLWATSRALEANRLAQVIFDAIVLGPP